METRITGIFPRAGKIKGVDIFGYTTKGIPGIDVVGMGSLSKKLKEKIIYLSKMAQLKIPLRKYTICVDEMGGKELTLEERVWLELPVLILFLSISKQIPIKKLEDCLCSGRIFVTGSLLSLEFSSSYNQKAFQNKLENHKFITHTENHKDDNVLKVLPLRSLLGHMPLFEYSSTRV